MDTVVVTDETATVDSTPAEGAADEEGPLAVETSIADIEETADELSRSNTDAEAAVGNEEALADLTRIRGIGSDYAEMLYQSGFTTIADLANATPDQLREALPPETHNLANFEDWIEQAKALLSQ